MIFLTWSASHGNSDYCIAMYGLAGMTSLVHNPGQKNILRAPVPHTCCAVGPW